MSRSRELNAYPKSLLRSPLDVRTAFMTYPRIGRGLRAGDRRRCRSRAQSSGFESLIQRGDLSLGVILLSLLITGFWGAVQH